MFKKDFAVSEENSTRNESVNDVVGNKTDTTAGASVVSLIKVVDTVVDGIDTKIDTIDSEVGTIDTVVDGIQADLDNATDGLGAIKDAVDTVDGFQDVATENGTANAAMRDVLGNKDDHSFSNYQTNPSVVGHLKAGYYHVHAPAKLYPKLADALPLDNDDGAGSAAGAWTEGDKQTIIPASTITVPFDIHWIKLFSISANDEYVLTLYNGTTELGVIGFSKVNNFISHVDSVIQIPPQAANSEITATLAAKDGTAARSITLKVFYHEYPDIT